MSISFIHDAARIQTLALHAGQAGGGYVVTASLPDAGRDYAGTGPARRRRRSRSGASHVEAMKMESVLKAA